MIHGLISFKNLQTSDLPHQGYLYEFLARSWPSLHLVCTEVSTYFVRKIALPPADQEDLQGVILNEKGKKILNVLIQFYEYLRGADPGGARTCIAGNLKVRLMPWYYMW